MHFFSFAVPLRLLQPVLMLPDHLFSRRKPSGSLTVIRLILLSCILLFISSVQAEPLIAPASVHEFKGSGEIFIITHAYHMVVVDIMEGNRKRLIGGKLAVDAMLFKGDTKVELRHFHIGEKVRMSWRETDRGKEIITLLSDESTAPAADENAPDPFEQAKSVPYIATPGNVEPQSAHPQPAQPEPAGSVIGAPSRHLIGNKETLLDIARNYDLGYNELADLYPDYDPWLPPAGREIVLPTERILPDGKRKGIVINIPELRLYYFTGKDQSLQITTHPVGIGDTDFETPPGVYSVGNKRANPTWYIPPSLRAKYQVSTIAPGPDNPLGKYWLGLKDTMYGIHGTDIPWAVGRTVTHGCIRMYPEDIERFFPIIEIGTPVQIVYEPVKIAVLENRILIEIHRDIYGKISDIAAFARQKAIAKGVWQRVDQQKFMTAVQDSKGIPVNVTATYHTDRLNSLAPAGAAVYANGASAASP